MSARPTSRPYAARAPRAAGFSLIEVVIALGVFMVGALTLSIVMPMATKRIVSAASQTRASELAAECAEQVLVTPWNDATITSGGHNGPTNPRDRIYYVHWDVEDNQPVTNCKRITVGVNRNSVSGPSLAQVVVVVPQAGVTVGP